MEAYKRVVMRYIRANRLRQKAKERYIRILKYIRVMRHGRKQEIKVQRLPRLQ
jgi:hypothetical protein